MCACACVCVCVRAHTCVCMWVHVRVPVWVRVRACVCMCVHVCACVCVYISKCVMCVHACRTVQRESVLKCPVLYSKWTSLNRAACVYAEYMVQYVWVAR